MYHYSIFLLGRLRCETWPSFCVLPRFVARVDNYTPIRAACVIGAFLRKYAGVCNRVAILCKDKIFSTFFNGLSLQRKQIKPRMKIKFYNDIVSEEERVMMEWNGVQNAVSYQSIVDALAARKEDDKIIDLVFNCRGGLITEGWAIYDLLRQQADCTINALIEGQCSSMASVILLAAPAENRKAFENAHLCIHNPAVMCLDGEYKDRYTADDIAQTAERLVTQAEMLRDEQARIVALYAERTGTDAETLQALMNEDTYIGMTRAKELGFIAEILAPMTAKKETPFSGQHNNIKDKMSKQTETKAGKFEKIMTALKELVGLDDAPKMVALQVTAADGSVLEIDLEEGEPQVGDAANPDGSYVMEDGTTIVVEGGVITEITAPAEPTEPEQQTEPTEEPQDAAEPQDAEGETEPEPEPETEPSEADELKSKIAELQAEIEELQKKLAEAEQNEKDAEDSAILEMVAQAGGKDAVLAAINARSTFNASNTRRVERASQDTKDALAFGDSYIEEKRKAFIEARAKMTK